MKKTNSRSLRLALCASTAAIAFAANPAAAQIRKVKAGDINLVVTGQINSST